MSFATTYHIVVQILGQLSGSEQKFSRLFEVGDPLAHLLALLRPDAHVQVRHGVVVGHLELAIPEERIC